MSSVTGQRQRGFTMVEMVVAMVMSAMVIASVAMLMSAPVSVHFAREARDELMTEAGDLTRQMRVDLSRALPNSVRIRNSGSISVLEMLIVQQARFYRPAGSLPIPDPNRELDFATADAQFVVYPQLDATMVPSYAVVENRGTTGYTAYALANVIAKAPFTVTPDAANNEDRLQPTTPFKFRVPSATDRIFFVSGPVSYVCNAGSTAMTLHRYENYPITSSIPTSETSGQLLGAQRMLINGHVSACRFVCAQGSSAPCRISVTASMAVRRTLDGRNETLRVVDTIPVDNRS
jgi:MSHA biogenesis protein MshO